MLYREPDPAATDPWVTLAALAATTERLRLGVLVCALARRRPWKVARETAALDLLSGGRLVFGAGLGSIESEFAAFGESAEPRVRARRLDEGLRIVTALWSGEPLEHAGEHYRVEAGPFRPRPVQRPRIPVWIAGRWPARRPFRRAARWDGVFPTHREVGADETMSAAQLAEIVDYTRAHRESARPLDVIVEGQSSGPGDRDRVAELAGAGLTWWIEKLSRFDGDLDAARARIEAGPPRPGQGRRG